MSFQHYGQCSLIAGFFWAFGQAVREPAWKGQMWGFEKLCVNALADYKLVSNQAELNILAFNAVEENEESRENDGFTGTRRALLVMFGVQSLLQEKRMGEKWTFNEVHVWLKKNIKFHDLKSIPSAVILAKVCILLRLVSCRTNVHSQHIGKLHNYMVAAPSSMTIPS